MSSFVLASAHIITSDITREKRSPLINALESALAKLSPIVRLTFDTPSSDGTGLEAPHIPPLLSQNAHLVDLDPKHVTDPAMSPLCTSLPVRAISNALKHHAALKSILGVPQSPGSSDDPEGSREFSLIVEDDAIFSETPMIDAVTRAVLSAPSDADLIFLGLPSKRSIEGSKESSFDDVSEMLDSQVLPACDSYLITRACAKRLESAFLPIRFMTNMQWTYLIRTGVVKKAYISVPNAFVDGSKLGVFSSSLSTNNRLIWNQGYCRLLSMVTQKEVKNFKEVWNEQSAMVQNHPDMLALLGDFYSLSGMIREAKATYEKALKRYEQDGCLVNTNSEFMKSFMRLYQFDQETELPV